MKPLTQERDSLARLVTLLDLMRRARMVTDPIAFTFQLVNETHLLAPFRQAALWRCFSDSAPQAGGYVEAVSGLAVPDHDAPYIFWLSRVLDHLARSSLIAGDSSAESRDAGESTLLSQAQATLILPASLAEEWNDWLPAYAIWLPLTLWHDSHPSRTVLGGLFLVRETPWLAEERQLLEELAGSYALVWKKLLTQRSLLSRFEDVFYKRVWRSGRSIAWAVFLLALVSLFFPVRQSVLAPAVVSAANPILVRSPLAGIIDRFHIIPNAVVNTDQLLFSLEDTQLRNQLETAQKEEEVAAAEFRQAVQKATRDPRRVAQSVVEQKRLEQKKADVDFLRDRLKLVDVRATRSGIAVFSDTNDWIGRPVKVGERILLLADPQQVELEIHLPVADAINLEVGAEVAMFLNIHPGAPLPAVLHYASYEAEVTAEGILAYRVKAHFVDLKNIPRIGLAGFARIYHHRITLFELISRRPLAAVRRWLSF